MGENNSKSTIRSWVIALCVVIATGIFAWGSIVSGWLDMPRKLDTIDEHVNQLLVVQAHRIFIVVPENRTVQSSTNPRVFEIEIPPNAVTEPTPFEFDQRPVIPLPAVLPPEYNFLGWSAAFGPEGLQLLEPFTGRVRLETDEQPGNVGLLYWSTDNMVWENVPINVEKDLLTGENILIFSTTETGLYALASKGIR